MAFKAVAILSAVLLLAVAPAPSAAQLTDIDIANFALNLEYLEANFYSCAAFGKPLDAEWRGNGPKPLGCKKAKLSPPALAYATALANDEIAHVKLLRSVLGDKAVAQPLLDIGKAFDVAANAVLMTTKPLTPAFDAYANDVLFYHASFIFEDLGVTAYKGAAPLITDKGILETAAGILAVEAYHGGAIRVALLDIAKQTVFPYGATVETIVGAISAGRAGLSGKADDLGLFTAKGGYVLAPGDSNAVAFSRTPEQVLNIAYLGGKGKGGFFPKGISTKP